MVASWNALERGWLVACSLGLASLISCGGKQFASHASGGTDGSNGGQQPGDNQAGSDGLGGEGIGGDGSTGGTMDRGGASGAGAACDCPAAHYCREGSTDCFACAELSRLRFHAPERLATLSDNGDGSRFPRVGATSTDLLYRVEGVGIRYTTDASTSAGSSVMQTMPQDSAPLLLSGAVTPSAAEAAFNFAFDRVTEGTRRQLFVGTWNNGLSESRVLPAPYNTDGSSAFSLAIALNATTDGLARAYWMTDRDPSLGISLVTSLFTLNPPEVAVSLQISANACPPDQDDLTPWVAPDGKTLLLSNTRLDASCAPANQGKDLYTALMQPTTGQPSSPAVPVSDVNGPADDVDPSFSPDFCDLYFASNRDGSYALYRAHRR